MITSMPHPEPSVGWLMVAVNGADLEVFRSDPVDHRGPIICAAHPADAFGEKTVRLLGDIASAQIICVNPRGIGSSLADRSSWRLMAANTCRLRNDGLRSKAPFRIFF